MKKLVAVLCAALFSVFFAACSSNSLGSLSPEESIEMADEWAGQLEHDALDALAQEGVIASVAEDAALLDDVFDFELMGDTTRAFDIVFQDMEAGQALEGDYALDAGSKVVLCSNTLQGTIPHVAYNDDLVGENDEGDVLPLFRPNRYGTAESTLPYLGDAYDALMDGISPDVFANSLAECDYLIVYDAIDSYVRENYYVGDIDRTTVTTIAVVFDARSRTVAHIEVIGSDTPNGVHEGPSGELLADDLAHYLNALLKGSQAS